MSLDYNLSKIQDRAVHFPPETDPAITAIMGTLNLKVHAAIWACIAVQIGEITEENADEWYFRYRFWNALQDGDVGPLRLTRRDVHLLVGLSTNVFPNMDRTTWIDRLLTRFEQDLDYSDPKEA